MNAVSLKIDKTRGTLTSGNTRVVVNAETQITTVTLHQTDIAIIDYRKQTVRIDCGGWHTPTTEAGINQVLSELGLDHTNRFRFVRIKGAPGVPKLRQTLYATIDSGRKDYPKEMYYQGVKVGDLALIAFDGTLLNAEAYSQAA